MLCHLKWKTSVLFIPCRSYGSGGLNKKAQSTLQDTLKPQSYSVLTNSYIVQYYTNVLC